MFYARDNTIFCGVVGSLHQLNAKRLAVQTPFTIESISINSTGTFLAIVGAQRLYACILPSPGFLSRPEETYSVKFWELSGHSDAHVLKAIWNPLSRYDSDLVVLTSDSHVRSYDLMTNPETPDQVIELSQSQQNSGSIGIGLEDPFEPVSICFGKAGDSHSRLTLYVLSKEGDVFAVCPFVPRSFILTENDLAELFDAAVAAEFEYRHSENSAIPVRRHYKAQLDYISDLWKQAPMTITETRAPHFGAPLVTSLVLSRPKTSKTPVVQGPFSLEPYPEEFYSTTGADIESLDAGLTVFCLSFQNGSTMLATDTNGVDLCWSNNVDLGQALAVVEVICFKGEKLGVSSDQNKFYITGSKNVFSIDPSPWTQLLLGAIKEAELDELSANLNNLPQSNVVGLVASNDGSPVAGVATLKGPSGGIYTVALTQKLWVDSPPVTQNTGTRSQDIKEDSTPETATYLGKPFTAEHALSSISLHPRVANSKLLTSHMTLDWETLTTLNQLGEFYSTELGKLHRIGLTMNGRLIDQRSELRRQLEKTASMPERLEKLSCSDIPDRTKEVVERQAKLQERIEKLHSQLNTRGISLLSEQEKKWAEELKRLQTVITGEKGITHRSSTAIAQSNIIINETKLQALNKERGLKQASSARPIEGLGTETFIRLKQALTKEGQLVNHTKATLDDLMKSMDKLSFES